MQREEKTKKRKRRQYLKMEKEEIKLLCSCMIIFTEYMKKNDLNTAGANK